MCAHRSRPCAHPARLMRAPLRDLWSNAYGTDRKLDHIDLALFRFAIRTVLLDKKVVLPRAPHVPAPRAWSVAHRAHRARSSSVQMPSAAAVGSLPAFYSTQPSQWLEGSTWNAERARSAALVHLGKLSAASRTLSSLTATKRCSPNSGIACRVQRRRERTVGCMTSKSLQSASVHALVLRRMWSRACMLPGALGRCAWPRGDRQGGERRPPIPGLSGTIGGPTARRPSHACILCRGPTRPSHVIRTKAKPSVCLNPLAAPMMASRYPVK